MLSGAGLGDDFLCPYLANKEASPMQWLEFEGTTMVEILPLQGRSGSGLGNWTSFAMVNRSWTAPGIPADPARSVNEFSALGDGWHRPH